MQMSAPATRSSTCPPTGPDEPVDAFAGARAYPVTTSAGAVAAATVVYQPLSKGLELFFRQTVGLSAAHLAALSPFLEEGGLTELEELSDVHVDGGKEGVEFLDRLTTAMPIAKRKRFKTCLKSLVQQSSKAEGEESRRLNDKESADLLHKVLTSAKEIGARDNKLGLDLHSLPDQIQTLASEWKHREKALLLQLQDKKQQGEGVSSRAVEMSSAGTQTRAVKAVETTSAMTQTPGPMELVGVEGDSVARDERSENEEEDDGEEDEEDLDDEMEEEDEEGGEEEQHRAHSDPEDTWEGEDGEVAAKDDEEEEEDNEPKEGKEERESEKEDDEGDEDTIAPEEEDQDPQGDETYEEGISANEAEEVDGKSHKRQRCELVMPKHFPASRKEESAEEHVVAEPTIKMRPVSRAWESGPSKRPRVGPQQSVRLVENAEMTTARAAKGEPSVENDWGGYSSSRRSLGNAEEVGHIGRSVQRKIRLIRPSDKVYVKTESGVHRSGVVVKTTSDCRYLVAVFAHDGKPAFRDFFGSDCIMTNANFRSACSSAKSSCYPFCPNFFTIRGCLKRSCHLQHQGPISRDKEAAIRKAVEYSFGEFELDEANLAQECKRHRDRGPAATWQNPHDPPGSWYPEYDREGGGGRTQLARRGGGRENRPQSAISPDFDNEDGWV